MHKNWRWRLKGFKLT